MLMVGLLKRFLLLQQFHLTIIDKLGEDNLVVVFCLFVCLCRLSIFAEEGMVDNHFSDEYLFSIFSYIPWFVGIANSLTTRKLPPHLSYRERCNIIREIPSYTWIVGCLFKLGLDRILRRCVKEDEVHDILEVCHDGPCEEHFLAKSMRKFQPPFRLSVFLITPCI